MPEYDSKIIFKDVKIKILNSKRRQSGEITGFIKVKDDFDNFKIKETYNYKDKIFEGEVDFVSSRINADTRSLLSRIKVENKNLELISGSLLEVKVKFDLRSSLSVPDTSVMIEGEKSYVYKINDKNIAEISKLTISDMQIWTQNIDKNIANQYKEIANPIIKEISLRLKFLIDVGLDYLTLSRESGTLSGGESQRIRLASQIGSGLTGVIYVLDEPSIGLHQKDNIKLINALKRLRDLGNTVIVVEHDTETMENADHIIDMGPEAGNNGGQVIVQGNYNDILNSQESITGKYLSYKKFISIPTKRRLAKNGRFLEINGATGNNLKNVNLKIPLGTFTCVTGVSGSGKSTLILQTLYNALNLTLNNNKSRKIPKPFKGFKGTELIDKVIDIDQSPIGRTPRSNPATYTLSLIHI